MLDRLKNAIWTEVRNLKVGDKIAVRPAADVAPALGMQSPVSSGRSVLNESGLIFDEIVSIKPLGRQQVYDIEVDGTHNFVANGILAHNTLVSGASYFANGTTYYVDASGNAKFNDLIVTDSSNPGLTLGDGTSGHFKIGAQTISANATGIGIGTTGPGYKLEVNASNGIFGVDTASSGFTRLKFGGTDANTAGVINRITGSETLYFGETSDTGDYIFRSSGDTIIEGSLGVGANFSPDTLLDVSGNNSENALRLRTGDSTTFTGGGNQILLSYNGDTSYTHAIKSRHNAGADSNNSIDFYVWDYGTDAAGAVGTKHVMSLNGGNVGIGTTAPSGKLDIEMSGTSTNYAYIGATSTSGTSTLNSGLIFQSYDGSAIASKLALYGTGDTWSYGGINANAGVVTAPSTSTGGLYLGATAGNITFYTGALPGSGGTRMTIDSTGNVGIGTTNPGYKLEVIGGGTGVYGSGTTTGVYGSGAYGVYGSGSSYGMYGSSSTGYGVYGYSDSTGYALYCNATTANKCGGNQAWYNASDRKLKENIVPINNALEKVLHLQGVTYNLKSDPAKTPQMGFIAQDVLPYVPEAVAYDESNDYWGMQTGQLTALLVNAIQELNSKLDTLTQNLSINFQTGIAVIQDLTADYIKVRNLMVDEKLISPVAYIEDLEVKNITAQTINAPQISKIEQEILDLTAKYSTASAILADLQKGATLRPAADIDQALSLQSPVPDGGSFPDVLILTDLQVNNSLIANLLNSKDQDTLFIQPLANAPINLLAGLMTLTPDGKVIINGDLAVTGKVLASKIETLQADLENLSAQTATISALTTSQLTIRPAAELAQALSLQSPVPDGGSLPNVATSSASTVASATLLNGTTEITISNTNVTQDTYIYLTPTSSTSNQTLFVKSKEIGKFTIAIPQAVSQDITFNYWLIQTIK